MARLLFTLLNLTLLTIVSLATFFWSAHILATAQYPYQILGSMLLGTFAIGTLLWGGETVVSYLFPSKE
jgi:nitrogen fixation-related uncharacterized protein